MLTNPGPFRRVLEISFWLAVSSVAAPDLVSAQPSPEGVAGDLSAAVARLEEITRLSAHHVDIEPSVAVGGEQGYRVVLRRHWKEPPPGYHFPQQARAAHERDE